MDIDENTFKFGKVLIIYPLFEIIWFPQFVFKFKLKEIN